MANLWLGRRIFSCTGDTMEGGSTTFMWSNVYLVRPTAIEIQSNPLTLRDHIFILRLSYIYCVCFVYKNRVDLAFIHETNIGFTYWVALLCWKVYKAELISFNIINQLFNRYFPIFSLGLRQYICCVIKCFSVPSKYGALVFNE